MPTYQYRCLACDAKFELEQSMEHKPKAFCPECGTGGTWVIRIPFPQKTIMKDYGFYRSKFKEDKKNDL